MKPSEEVLTRRNKECISERLFNLILRNLIMCTILSGFIYRAFNLEEITLLNMLLCYGITTLIFYIALGFGQIPFLVFNEKNEFNQHPRAPKFYANQNVLVRGLILISMLLVSFLAQYFIISQLFK